MEVLLDRETRLNQREERRKLASLLSSDPVRVLHFKSRRSAVTHVEPQYIPPQTKLSPLKQSPLCFPRAIEENPLQITVLKRASNLCRFKVSVSRSFPPIADEVIESPLQQFKVPVDVFPSSPILEFQISTFKFPGNLPLSQFEIATAKFPQAEERKLMRFKIDVHNIPGLPGISKFHLDVSTKFPNTLPFTSISKFVINPFTFP